MVIAKPNRNIKKGLFAFIDYMYIVPIHFPPDSF